MGKSKKSEEVSPGFDTSDLFPGMRPAPDDVKHDDGIVEAWDGLELYWQTWEPAEARGVVCLMHGFGEHSARYHHLATYLVRSGYAVIAFDCRGHGRSGGPRGHVDEFSAFPRDLDLMFAEAERRWPGIEPVVFGHSNGGLIALHHALMTRDRGRAYVVSSPFLGFKVKVPFLKAAAGNLMSSLWPTLALPTDLDSDVLTHNREINEQYAADPLVLGVASSRWFTETKAAQADLKERAHEISAPTLFLVAGRDELADPRASEEVYHRMASTDREFELLSKLKHEIFNEDGWLDLAARTVSWFDRFV
jgi:alpha-beta hydrolase superfamily lysophospholipase